MNGTAQGTAAGVRDRANRLDGFDKLKGMGDDGVLLGPFPERGAVDHEDGLHELLARRTRLRRATRKPVVAGVCCDEVVEQGSGGRRAATILRILRGCDPVRNNRLLFLLYQNPAGVEDEDGGQNVANFELGWDLVLRVDGQGGEREDILDAILENSRGELGHKVLVGGQVCAWRRRELVGDHFSVLGGLEVEAASARARLGDLGRAQDEVLVGGKVIAPTTANCVRGGCFSGLNMLAFDLLVDHDSSIRDVEASVDEMEGEGFRQPVGSDDPEKNSVHVGVPAVSFMASM